MWSMTTPYHHGDLRNALVGAAVAAARVGGPGAVVLRDVARQVGVSHNAGYRHFAGRDDLLAAVADQGLVELALAMEDGLAAVPADPDPRITARRRLRAVGRAYVHYALAEPGLFRCIWEAVGNPAEDPTPGAPRPGALGPYQLLTTALDDLARTGALPTSRRAYSEIAAWAGVHGLATLVIDGPLAGVAPDEVEAALERLCDVIDAGL